MPNYSKHVQVCDVEKDDGKHCGNKGGAEIKKEFVRMVSKYGLRKDVYVSSAGCTSQHRLCEMDQCSVIVYGPNGEGTWYIAKSEDVETIVREHLAEGKKVESLVNEGLSTNVG